MYLPTASQQTNTNESRKKYDRVKTIESTVLYLVQASCAHHQALCFLITQYFLLPVQVTAQLKLASFWWKLTQEKEMGVANTCVKHEQSKEKCKFKPQWTGLHPRRVASQRPDEKALGKWEASWPLPCGCSSAKHYVGENTWKLSFFLFLFLTTRASDHIQGLEQNGPDLYHWVRLRSQRTQMISRVPERIKQRNSGVKGNGVPTFRHKHACCQVSSQAPGWDADAPPLWQGGKSPGTQLMR